MEPKTVSLHIIPRLKLMSFHWDEQGYYRLGNDFQLEDSSRQAIQDYSVWESETFGDRWEVYTEYHVVFSGVGGGKFPCGIQWIPLDRQRPLSLGETFRAVRKTPMTKREKERQQQLLQQGKIAYQRHVSPDQYEKAIRELVWECVAIPVNQRNLTPAQKLMRFRRHLAMQAAGEADIRGTLWPNIALESTVELAAAEEAER